MKLPLVNPYAFCDDPASLDPNGRTKDTYGVISFSGGRTSAYLLRRVLDAFGGKLPHYIKVVFCNTGLEMPETLDFVNECSERWEVEIKWLEYRPKAWSPLMEQFRGEIHFGPDFVDPRGYEEVTFATASQHGEPFDALLLEFVKRRDGTWGVRPLPNPVSRICTTNLKSRLKHRWIRGELGWRSYVSALGIRGDEGNRVKRGFAEPGESLAYPLHADGVTRGIVLDFWRKQPFDLRLPVDFYGETIEGNCDFCFMKSAAKIGRIAAKHADRAKWWARAEARHALTDRPTVFRQDRPAYAQVIAAAASEQPIDFGLFDDMTSCGSHSCTD